MRQSALRTTEADLKKAFLPAENPIEALPNPKTSAARLGVALGWVGVGIGIAELLMPRAMAKTTGLPPRSVRALGTLELLASAGTLLQHRQPAWRWSRIAGDLIDLSLLAWAGRRTSNVRLPLITALFAGMTALDVLSAYDGQRQGARQGGLPSTLRICKSFHIQRSPEACYRFWRNFENFPKFMSDVDSVQVIDATRTHWRMRATRGEPVEWTVELFSDIPSQQLGWRTIADSPLEHSGVVKFLPAYGHTSTRLDIDIIYKIPIGQPMDLLSLLFTDEPARRWEDDLRRFKQLIETGEIATTLGQSSGRRGALVRQLHREGKS
jgi:uncharacterized membrane protein